MGNSRTREQALADPAQTNADITSVLAQAGMAPPSPPPLPGDTVTLPGGLVRDGRVRRQAVIRELTGADEEALSRAWQSGSLFRFMDVLIECGTVMIGDLPATPEVLKGLLLGDRDELALAVRAATYGDEMSIDGWQCPACGGLSDISFSLSQDVERARLDDPAAGVTFEVPLRKGGTALARLATGADQEDVYSDETWTPAQRNTRLLSRCVLALTSEQGAKTSVAAFPSAARDLASADRHAILRQLGERQPGPRYNKISFTHDGCKNEVTLALGITDLFRDLIAFL